MEKLQKGITILLVLLLGLSSVPINVIGEAQYDSETSNTSITTKQDDKTTQTQMSTMPISSTTSQPPKTVATAETSKSITETSRSATEESKPASVAKNAEPEQKNNFTILNKEKEETPNISIDYENEKLTGFDPTASYEMTRGIKNLSINNVSEYKITDEMMGMTSHGYEWKIVRLASDITKQDSDSQTVNIPMRRVIAANVITIKHETYKGAHDGQLQMSTSSVVVQYREEGEEKWDISTGTISNLDPGTYEVRYPATDKDFASSVRHCVIKAGLEKEATPEIKIDYKNEKLTGFDPAAKYEMIYGSEKLSIESVSEYKITDEMMGMTSHGYDWKIIRLSGDSSKQDSDPLTLNIPQRDNMPANYITIKHETYAGANDGQLTMNYNTMAVEYREKGTEEWIPVVGSATENLSPGTYEARYPVSNTAFASKAREYVIKAGLEKEATPEIKIDYKNEKLTGFDPAAKYEMIYGSEKLSIESVSEYKITDEMMGMTSHGYDWKIIRLSGDSSKQDSDPLTLNIPQRDNMPANYITIKHETYAGANDGQLTMNYNTMAVEYREKGTEEWIPVVGSATENLSPGTYEARYPVSNTAFASKVREYEIKAGPEKEDRLSVNPEKLNLEAALGFTPASLKSKVTITNTSEETVTNLSVASTEKAPFQLGEIDAPELAVGASVNFTIEPEAGLTVGTYETTLEITSNNATTIAIPVTFKVFAQGTVTVRYVDDKGLEIAEPDTLSDKVGESYSTKPKAIDGYTFKEVKGASSGVFSDVEQTVIYVYIKNEPIKEQNGAVTVHYVDESGRKLSDSETISGKVGDPYITKVKEIKGYTFSKVQGNPKGQFTINAQAVTYVYKKEVVSKVTSLNNQKTTGGTQRGSSASGQTSLIKAGEVVNYTFIILGLVILIVAMLVYRKNRKSNV